MVQPSMWFHLSFASCARPDVLLQEIVRMPHVRISEFDQNSADWRYLIMYDPLWFDEYHLKSWIRNIQRDINCPGWCIHV